MEKTDQYSDEELLKIYNDSEQVDKAHFAEQRTNILLYIGNHFKKKAQNFIERNKDSLSADTKLKLSENHIQVVANRFITNIANQVTGCLIVPNNPNELADIKDAELSNSVREDGEQRLNYHDKVEKLSNNYVVCGEAVQFFYFDPYGGKHIGYKQKLTDDGIPLYITPTGEETIESVGLMGEQLQPAQGDEPVFEGEIKMEVTHPYNLLRAKSAETIEDSPFLCIRKMLQISEAKKLIKNHPERESLESEIKTSNESTFKVFDASTGEYSDSKNQVLVKYWFFRQCYDYPNGYFKVQLNNKTIVEDELPFGIWPINYVGFRSVAGATRSVSMLRDLRPPQTHLNYLVSNSAHHMVALSDDKIITQMGTKLQMGQTWNGIRSFMVNGPAPVILQGRDAGQFEASINRQINAIYRLADMEYTLEESKIQDPWAMLYAGLSKKLRHALYASKFERFLCKGWEIYLALAKHYFDENTVIKKVGSREAVNIAEFKNMRNDGYRIKAKPVSGTLEEQIGASMEVQQILQYVGKDLPNSTKARIINLMPFISKEAVVSDLLLTDKNIDNDILSLDRGEFVPAQKDDEHDQYLKRLKSRMKQADYRLLPITVKKMYEERYQQHLAFQSELVADMQKAESGFIPTEGGLVKVSIFDSTTNQNMVLPYSAIMWTKDKLAQQGASQEVLSKLDQQTQKEILNKAQALAMSQQQNGMGMSVGMQQTQPMPHLA
ncbi:MAG: hypothetical protein ACK41T_03650 [Pseudobdellovibrio sp.]